MRIELGDQVKDKDSYYEGTVTARIDYLRRAPRFAVKTKLQHEGKPVEWVWFDENDLELAPELPTINEAMAEAPQLDRRR